MPYDFRPYVRQTEPTNGRAGKGVFIEMEKLYMYPDGHGYIDVSAIPDQGLPLLSQPFADPFQGYEILSGVWRVMWKQAKGLKRHFVVSEQVMIPVDGVLKAGFISSPWNAHHYKVVTDDGVERHVPADWVIGIKQ